MANTNFSEWPFTKSQMLNVTQTTQTSQQYMQKFKVKSDSVNSKLGSVLHCQGMRQKIDSVQLKSHRRLAFTLPSNLPVIVQSES